jgi:methylated-DNA-[protein]-cysteine S-methyltransferase
MTESTLYLLGGCRTTKIYCRHNCPAGRHMKPENRILFRSREEAISLGYRACKTCKPDDVFPEPEIVFRTVYDSPLGAYTIITSTKGVVSVSSPVTTSNRLERLEKRHIDYHDGGEFNDALAKELDAYFKGKLTVFTLPLDLRGTPFQLRVWSELRSIPYGEMSTYGKIAAATGNPAASRAVGHAIGSNPIAIIVPCHRVIGSTGSLTGYASGLERKRFLLNLEAKTTRKPATW